MLAPALALTVLVVVARARAWAIFRTPWPWLAPIAGLLAYGPVIGYNLANDLAGVERVQTRRNYAYETALSVEKYLQNGGDLWRELARIVSNPMRIPEEGSHYFTSPHPPAPRRALPVRDRVARLARSAAAALRAPLHGGDHARLQQSLRATLGSLSADRAPT